MAGDAAGTTYAFSGEGIGKALESGLLAAEALLPDREAAVQQRYEASLRALKPKFDLYDTAGHVNEVARTAPLPVRPRLLFRSSMPVTTGIAAAGQFGEGAHLF